MSNTLVSPRDFTRETTYGLDPVANLALVGDLHALPFEKLSDQGYTTTLFIPTGSLTTGLTFLGLLTDDGRTPGDLGRVVRLGITVKRLVSGENADLDAAAGTEQTVDVTLQATSGNLTAFTLAIANANLDSAAVLNVIGIRIRRIASATQDTAQGRVLLVGGLAVYPT